MHCLLWIFNPLCVCVCNKLQSISITSAIDHGFNTEAGSKFSKQACIAIQVTWIKKCNSQESRVLKELLKLLSYSLMLKSIHRASLVAQWLRICLPMQGTRVRALVWEDPTCRGATRPVSHNYWACASGACAPQQERPRYWEARAPRWRVAPTCHN